MGGQTQMTMREPRLQQGSPRMAGGSSMGAESWLQEGCILAPAEKLPARVTLVRPSNAQG